ncbi:hypothetical protein G6F68_016420 [Rhizopus microsporus]|nr:hypothetical protein G6F68_016420 [Rhizopus microsporus]
MQRNPQSSFFSRKCRAVKQRAEKASAMRPHTITSAAMSAGRSSNSRASRAAVIGVHMRARHESTACQVPHGAQFARFDHEVILVAKLLQRMRLCPGFDQGAAGQHHGLACGAQVARQVQPLVRAQVVAPATDGFADIEDVGRAVGQVGVEVQRTLARPVIQQRADGYLECGRFNFH